MISTLAATASSKRSFLSNRVIIRKAYVPYPRASNARPYDCNRVIIRKKYVSYPREHTWVLPYNVKETYAMISKSLAASP